MRIVMLCGNGEKSAIVYSKLSEVFSIEQLLVEGHTSRKVFLKRRMNRLGFLKTVGQILFSSLIVPILNREASKRKAEILETYSIRKDYYNYFLQDARFIPSVNSQECITILKEISPDIIIVNGTRLLSKEVIEATNAIIINMHTGITPKYRGSHGAYWALRNNDKENAGVTVHFIDEGIDTGKIIYQSTIPITADDNFTTYPFLQVCIGANDEIQAIKDIINGQNTTITNDLPSSIYDHPTFWGYLYHRIKHGIK